MIIFKRKLLIKLLFQIEILNKHLFITSKPVIYLVNLSEKDYIRKKNKWWVIKTIIKKGKIKCIHGNYSMKIIIIIITKMHVTWKLISYWFSLENIKVCVVCLMEDMEGDMHYNCCSLYSDQSSLYRSFFFFPHKLFIIILMDTYLQISWE